MYTRVAEIAQNPLTYPASQVAFAYIIKKCSYKSRDFIQLLLSLILLFISRIQFRLTY